MSKISAFAVTVLLLLPVASQASCLQPGPNRMLGQTVERQVVVKAGRYCRIHIGYSDGGVIDTRIVAKPSVGGLSAEGQAVTYTAKKGYSGSDSFTYERDELDRYGRKDVARVKVNVQVTP
jgi:hypothetical protein